MKKTMLDKLCDRLDAVCAWVKAFLLWLLIVGGLVLFWLLLIGGIVWVRFFFLEHVVFVI